MEIIIPLDIIVLYKILAHLCVFIEILNVCKNKNLKQLIHQPHTR